MQKIIYAEDGITVEQKVNIYDYVCNTCFCTLDECTCDMPPWELIMIDRGIQDSIRVLNEKGYTTVYCCEGHIGLSVSIYIQFDEDYEFDELPKDFTYKNNTLRYKFPKKFYKDEEKFNNDKEEHLRYLNDWVYTL